MPQSPDVDERRLYRVIATCHRRQASVTGRESSFGCLRVSVSRVFWTDVGVFCQWIVQLARAASRVSPASVIGLRSLSPCSQAKGR